MVNFYLSQDPIHRRIIEAMYEGCPEDKDLREMNYAPGKACLFGVYKKNIPLSWARGNIIKIHEAAGEMVIICETGYLRRGDTESNYYAVGLNGLNGRAEFRNEASPPDRFRELALQVKPWRKNGNHVLICGQVPWDASVDNINFKQWQRETVEKLKGLTNRKLVFRQHPKLALVRPLSEDLKDCWAAVTFNSNTAVEAAIEGIPVFVDDEGTMAGPVANWFLSDIENPKMPDREQWLYDLAYTQWKPREMREGKTWRHLFKESR